MNKILSRDNKTPDQLYNALMWYISNVNNSPDTSREIILVFDKINWLGIYWNPISQNWGISRHTVVWEEYSKLDTLDLKTKVEEYKILIDHTYALQYKTPAGIRIHIKCDE